jgi:hypothetical protein
VRLGTGENLPSWEDTKQAAQSVRNFTGSIYQDAYGNIGNAYQQFLMGGKPIYPDHASLNYEIAESAYDPTREDWQDYERYVDESSRDLPDPEPVEPEM